MHRSSTSVSLCAACVLLTATACSTTTPLTPTAPATTGQSGPDGSTLKASAPSLVSPVNSDTILTPRPTLVISAAGAQFSPNASLSYEFELQTDAGAVLGRTTQSSTAWAYPDTLGINTPYRWRARAVLGGAAGPWSAVGRFFSAKLPTPTAASSNEDWRVWFFQLIEFRGVGPTASAAALTALEPDLIAAGVILEKTSAGVVRGRLYLPTGSASNKFGRSVDIGDFGGRWQWVLRGATTCEGGNCP